MNLPVSATIVLAALNGILLIVITYLVYRLSGLLKGKGARDMEDTLRAGFSKITELESENDALKTRVQTLEQKMKEAIRNVETVRFNPFEDAGSNQSFASAFLNEEGNGVVISSLYARERVNVFAKPVERFSSQHELTGEEKEVVKRNRDKSSR